jgi:hypothetical protein
MVENSSNVYSKYQDFYRIGGVMVSVFVSSVQVKPKTIFFLNWCLLLHAKHAALRKKSKDWLTWNQNNVSEWGDKSIHELLFR